MYALPEALSVSLTLSEMSQLHDMTVAYFQAAKDYFWQWAEEGEVIEWIKDGGTICYKTELLHDLSRINNHLPPLGPLLLSVAGLAVLGVSGSLGGRLAYRYGVRVVDEATQATGFTVPADVGSAGRARETR